MIPFPLRSQSLCVLPSWFMGRSRTYGDWRQWKAAETPI